MYAKMCDLWMVIFMTWCLLTTFLFVIPGATWAGGDFGNVFAMGIPVCFQYVSWCAVTILLKHGLFILTLVGVMPDNVQKH